MRAIAAAAVLALGLATGAAEAQSVGIPKTFQPSLDAARSRRQLKNPPLTAAPSVKDTLYRVGDGLGMLRDIEERDAILTMAWDEGTPGTAATPTPNAVNDRLVRLWSLPYSVYKAAMLAGANAKTTLEGGVLYLSYPLPAPLTATARVALN